MLTNQANIFDQNPVVFFGMQLAFLKTLLKSLAQEPVDNVQKKKKGIKYRYFLQKSL